MSGWTAVVSVGLLAVGVAAVMEIDRVILRAIAQATQPSFHSKEAE
jgi:hypothetical protein